MQYEAFSDRLLPLSHVHFGFLRVFSWPDSPFLFIAEQ